MILISEILTSKSSLSPETLISCKKSELASKAIELMVKNHIGAVLVKNDDDSIAGVYSERDVVKNCKENSTGFLNERLENVMSSNVIQIGLDESLDDALNLMRKHRIRHLPVVEGSQVKGFLSSRDLMASRLDYEHKKSELLKDQMHAINRPLPM
jgi:CBS domain-containing protein